LSSAKLLGNQAYFASWQLDGGKARQIRCQPFRAAFPLPIGSVRNRTESLLSGRAMGVLQIA
jgi:hypothetical protein